MLLRLQHGKFSRMRVSYEGHRAATNDDLKRCQRTQPFGQCPCRFCVNQRHAAYAHATTSPWFNEWALRKGQMQHLDCSWCKSVDVQCPCSIRISETALDSVFVIRRDIFEHVYVHTVYTCV